MLSLPVLQMQDSLHKHSSHSEKPSPTLPDNKHPGSRVSWLMEYLNDQSSMQKASQRYRLDMYQAIIGHE